MALTITDETSVYPPGVFDTASPLATTKNPINNISIQGGNGLSYQLLFDVTTGSIYVYRINRSTVVRTLTQTLTKTTFETAVQTKSGIAKPEASAPAIIGALQPTGYVLCAQNSLGFGGTTFSIWKVDSSGTFVCDGAVRYDHGSDVNYAMYNINCCGLCGAQTTSDPIFVSYGSGLAGFFVMRAWRLPSISTFISQNGSTLSVGSNNISMVGSYDAEWGAPTTVRPGGPGTSGFVPRRSTNFGWVLPYGATGTRMYFWCSPPDISAAAAVATNFNYQMGISYGDQLVGYIDLGEVVYNGSWDTSFERTVDLSVLRSNDGASNLLPIVHYNADGTAIDAGGYGSYNPAPTIQKLANGSTLVLFCAGIQQEYSNQYSGSPYDFVCRWLGFEYTKGTGKHRLVGKGSFQPANRVQMTNGVYFDNRLLPTNPLVEYDEGTKQLFWSFDGCFIDYSGTSERNAFGSVGIPLVFAANTSFLSETDITYNDFVAKYP